MTERLTIAAARPGMRVECTKTFHDMGGSVIAGRIYTVAEVKAGAMGGTVARLKETGDLWFNATRFIPAPEQPPLAALLAERAPEFLAAVLEWHRVRSSWIHFGSLSGRVLHEAIERAGLIAQEPRTTEREATIREGWWA